MHLVLSKNFDAADAPAVLERARSLLRLPPDAKLRVENVTRTARGTRIDFSYISSIELDDDALADVAGVRVDVTARGDLRFDAKGNLAGYDVQPADPRQLRAITDHISKLIANGEIYIARPGEEIDPDQLRAQGKSWYMQEDEHGNKYLRRSYIS